MVSSEQADNGGVVAVVCERSVVAVGACARAFMYDASTARRKWSFTCTFYLFFSCLLLRN